MILKTLKILAVSIYAVCGGLLIFFTLPQTGWKALSVATGSMTPAIPQGSLVLVHRIPNRSLKVGDVVTYINPSNTKQTITHRIVEVTSKQGLPVFITRGDANQANDPEILGGNIVGKVEWYLPIIGKIISLVHKPIGLILLVVIPGILIIIDEMRRLVAVLSDQKPIQPTPAVPVEQKTLPTPVAPKDESRPVTPTKPPSRHRRRSMDGVGKHLVLLLGVLVLVVHTSQAALVSQATLTGNTISTAPRSNHLEIFRVSLGGRPTCPTLTGGAISIFDTEPNSQNSLVNESSCRIEIENDNNVKVINGTNQNSQSGNSSNQSNSSGGSSSTGNVNNSNSDETNITIANGRRSPWIQLYNPTDFAVNLHNWQIKDDSGIAQNLPNRTIPKHGTIIITAEALGGHIGDGLTRTGDRLILLSPGHAQIDGLSWGSDTSVLNPAVPAIPVGGSAKRIHPDFDTDTASDWIVQGP